jgi:hypothetical protein
MCFIFLNPIKYQDLPKKIYFKIFRLELNFVQILEVPKDLNLLGKRKIVNRATGPALAHEQLAPAGLGFAGWAFAKKAAVHNTEQACGTIRGHGAWYCCSTANAHHRRRGGSPERTTRRRERGRTHFWVSQLRARLGTAAHRGSLSAMAERVRLAACSTSVGSKLRQHAHGEDE